MLDTKVRYHIYLIIYTYKDSAFKIRKYSTIVQSPTSLNCYRKYVKSKINTDVPTSFSK